MTYLERECLGLHQPHRYQICPSDLKIIELKWSDEAVLNKISFLLNCIMFITVEKKIYTCDCKPYGIERLLPWGLPCMYIRFVNPQ